MADVVVRAKSISSVSTTFAVRGSQKLIISIIMAIFSCVVHLCGGDYVFWLNFCWICGFVYNVSAFLMYSG